MEEILHHWFEGLPLVVLILIIAVSLYVLAKGADILVEEAVALSKIWGVPPVVIGATIVSLGTTLPEAAVSVAAAVSGNPDLALGNAVGSIITDCGLILGLAAIISPLPLNRSVVNRQGWIQIGAGFLLVLLALPWSHLGSALESGGTVPQWAGFLLLVLLAVYMIFTIKSAQGARKAELEAEVEEADEPRRSNLATVLLLLVGIALVVGASQVLIPAVEISAVRVGVPQAIIAATLVAFGTSLPELVTSLNAVRRGHGELAVGNVIGADILNVLFVAGASAAVTPAGLYADPRFMKLLFPGMLLILITFRLGVFFQKDSLGRGFGIVLLLLYAAVMGGSYLI
jgi:cation:H+ antiporter